MVMCLATAIFLTSCATSRPKGNPDYDQIATIVRSHIGTQEWLGNIEVTASGDSATAYYVLQQPMAQKPEPMKACFVKKQGAWILMSTLSYRPWLWRYK
jgi:hypothetical protein